MDETQFLATMIQYVNYEYDGENQSELLSILRNSIILYAKTTDYTKKSHQYWEDIDIRVPIPLLKRAKELQPKFNLVAKEIYIESPSYNLKNIRIKPKPIDLATSAQVEHDVVFDEIKNTIIQGIRNSKYLIWIAVAWFTDKEIYDELKLRQQDGVNIRIITSKEESNRYLMNELLKSFDTVAVPTWDHHRLHDKFCIIDLDYVMHGSFNWSKNAGGNKETLATALDRDFVKKFTDEFISLYKEYSIKSF